MLVVGLLLIALSGALAGLLLAFNAFSGQSYPVELFGRELFTATPVQIFLAGIVLALTFCLGLWAIGSAQRHSRIMRAQIRSARREAQTAAAERDQLAEQLTQQHSPVPEPPAPTTPKRTPKVTEAKVDGPRHASTP